MRESITIVDEDDNVTGSKARGAITHEDIYRVSSLWLTDMRTGDCLIAQRKWDKQNHPGKWANAASGTVATGESYAANVQRETREELGLNGVTFTLGPKQYIDNGKHRFFCQWYFAEIDKEAVQITVQKDEVEAVKWMPVKELITDVAEHPDSYAPPAMNTLKLLGVV